MSGPKQIDLGTLPLEQLAQLRETLESELLNFNRSVQALGTIASRFHRTGEAVEDLQKETEGKPVLLPLTDSMYIQGELADTKNVLVDIGTGYYVEKTTEQAIDFAKRRVNVVRDNMESIMTSMADKRQALMIVTQVMNGRIREQQAQGAGAGAAALASA